MVRKALWMVGALGLGMTFFFGRDAVSYVRTSIGWVQDSVRDSIPLDFEIDRARKMVQNLMPDIRRNMHVIAQEEVEVDRLEKQIHETKTTMEKDHVDLMQLKTDLASNRPDYHYGGRTFTVQQVKTDLSNRFERYKTHDATLTSLRDIQQARRKSLEAARQKLEGMLATKRQLEVDVENLEARLKMVEVAQTTSNYNFDDSQLSRAKELISDLRTRLSVNERLVNAENEFPSEIPVSQPKSENIVEQVTDYFAEPSDAKLAETAAKSKP